MQFLGANKVIPFFMRISTTHTFIHVENNLWRTSLFHYYTNFNGGGQKGLTEVGRPTASDLRSRLIMALTKVVGPTASVNRLTEAGDLGQPPRLILINGGDFPYAPCGRTT
jgi:hypothetical protein